MPRSIDPPLAHALLSSPLGPLHLAATAEGLVHVLFSSQDPALGVARVVDAAEHPVLAHAARELQLYFAGRLKVFTVPLAPRGTLFQIAVWRALQAIPFGARHTYRDVARAIDRVGAERAVGAANGKNRIGIIVPCHRVVAADGALTGYAAGLDKKRWLLAHEARHASDVRRDPQLAIGL